MLQKRQKVLAKGPKQTSATSEKLLHSLTQGFSHRESGQIHCLIVVAEGDQQHPWQRVCELAMSPVGTFAPTSAARRYVRSWG